MPEAKIYQVPDCSCQASGRTGLVAQATALTYGKACRSLHVCQGAADTTLEETILCLIAGHTLTGTIIESGTQEAQWEIERVMTGLEARLMARAADIYKQIEAMTPEERKSTEDGMTILHEKLSAAFQDEKLR